jgi:hypothetical protein
MDTVLLATQGEEGTRMQTPTVCRRRCDPAARGNYYQTTEDAADYDVIYSLTDLSSNIAVTVSFGHRIR